MRKRARIAIIGAGPAGITAAIQLARFGYKPQLFEKNMAGGLLKNAYLVENYPGFAQGLSGIDLVKKLTAHLSKYRIPVIKSEIKSASYRQGYYFVRGKTNIRADFLIIASGTKAKQPLISMPLKRTKILNEIYQIRNVKNKNIAIIGAGDAALDYALNLSRFNRVALFNRNAKIKGLFILYKRLNKERKKDRFVYYPNTQVTGIENNGSSFQLYCHGKRLNTQTFDYVILATGREPALDFLAENLQKNYPEGTKSLYFIGDVKNGEMRQTSIAIADGMKAAMSINSRDKTCGN